MKSIIQEASSMSKAIEKSWEKAGKPQEFSVKLLEEAEKNFLGLTKKPAKIALFFDETKIKIQKKIITPKRHAREKRPQQARTRKQPARPTAKKALWSDEMVNLSKTWTTNVLAKMKKANVKFTTNVRNKNLKILFDAPLLPDRTKQKMLFANFAFLLMQSLRYKCKRSFSDLKIVFMVKS